jgi:hypothetical protein
MHTNPSLTHQNLPLFIDPYCLEITLSISFSQTPQQLLLPQPQLSTLQQQQRQLPPTPNLAELEQYQIPLGSKVVELPDGSAQPKQILS